MRHWFKALGALALVALATTARADNPIVPGWYADPEIHVFAGRYWIYPTLSDTVDGKVKPTPLTPEQKAMRAKPNIRPAFLRQTYMDAFSSPDLVNWTKHPRILDTGTVKWAAYAIWAPSAIELDGRYYLFFGANDVHQGELGGIGVAVSDTPGGPFRDLLGKPLIGDIHNGAQPIDQFVFRDDDGQIYLFYGGWGHCNVVRLSHDLSRVEPFPDGTTYREITPDGYVEGSFMLKRRGTYYLMWSEGGWTGPDYRVAYAMAHSPTGPFKRIGTVLQQDLSVARGAGHHSVLNIPGSDDWIIAYHRRPLTTDKGDHRELALERLVFNADGTIAPVKLTTRGVGPAPLAP